MENLFFIFQNRMESMEFLYYAITKSASIQYVVEVCSCMPIMCTKYEDGKRFNNLCKIGCPNYSCKWSCPPFAPLFTDISLKWDKLYIIFMHIDLSQFSYIRNDYLKVKAANSILKSRADQFIRKMADMHGSCISTGSCRLCKPCKCKLNMPCAHPSTMSYSFEALGINVGQLVEDLFQTPLIWYKKHCLPKYTSVVCGILTNENLSDEYLQNSYKKYITH